MTSLYKFNRFMILCCLFVAPLSNVQSAEITANEFFRKQAQIIPAQMVRVGESRFGRLSIADIQSLIAKVEWRLNTDPQRAFAGSGGSRTFAINIPGENLVVVNAFELKKLDPATIQMISLHESLMAIGFDDENYQISMMMNWFNSKMEYRGPNERAISSSLRTRLAALPKPNAVTRLYPDQRVEPYTSAQARGQQFASAGGATSVGGGGDGPSMELKAVLMMMITTQRALVNQQAPRLSAKSDVELINQIIDLPVEPMPFSMNYRAGDTLVIWSREHKLELMAAVWDASGDRARIVLSAIQLLGGAR